MKNHLLILCAYRALFQGKLVALGETGPVKKNSHKWRFFSLRSSWLVNLPLPPTVTCSEIAGLIIRAYESTLVSLHKALLNPYFWGVYVRGVVGWPSMRSAASAAFQDSPIQSRTINGHHSPLPWLYGFWNSFKCSISGSISVWIFVRCGCSGALYMSDCMHLRFHGRKKKHANSHGKKQRVGNT